MYLTVTASCKVMNYMLQNWGN